MLQVYENRNDYAVDPAQFLRRIAQLPMGADFCDGGQHDAQELFRLLLDSLHDDLVSHLLLACRDSQTQQHVHRDVVDVSCCMASTERIVAICTPQFHCRNTHALACCTMHPPYLLK